MLNDDGEHEQIELGIVAESIDKKCLLVGECKWTPQENGRQLTATLLRKAGLLPFAKGHTIVPVLFLKNEPDEDEGNAMLPADILKMLY